MNRNYYTDSEDDIFNPGMDLIVSLLAVLLIVLFIGAKFYLDQKLTNAKKTIFPPYIIIDNADKYAFPSGRGDLTKELKKFIRNELVNKIEENIEKYDISIIEIIGHTDGQIVSSPYSNLDNILEKVANDIVPIEELSPNSNADLGLVRALAVVKELQKIQREEGRLKKLNPKQGFRAYSAAQLTLRSGEFSKADAKSDADRRRIEIRFTHESIPLIEY
jgi:outer membrane protein OmpA-like peptidoglycan-associated protein